MDGGGIFSLERRHGAHLPLPPGDDFRLAGADGDQIGPHLADAVEDAFFGAFASRDHEDHGGHAHDDAQHAEQRPQLVGRQDFNGKAKLLENFIATLPLTRPSGAAASRTALEAPTNVGIRQCLHSLDASTGCNLAARLAGCTPKNVPTRSAKPIAKANGCQETTAGMGVSLAIPTATAPPKYTSHEHSQNRHTQGFGEKLHEHIAARGSQRTPQSDLLGSLRHGDEQDVHQDDAANQKAQGGQCHQQHREGPRCAARKFGDDRRRDDAKVVFQGGSDVVPLRISCSICSACWSMSEASSVTIRMAPTWSTFMTRRMAVVMGMMIRLSKSPPPPPAVPRCWSTPLTVRLTLLM